MFNASLFTKEKMEELKQILNIDHQDHDQALQAYLEKAFYDAWCKGVMKGAGADSDE